MAWDEVLSEDDLKNIIKMLKMTYHDFICKYYVGRKEKSIKPIKHFDGNWYHPDYYILVIYNNILTEDEFYEAYLKYFKGKG